MPSARRCRLFWPAAATALFVASPAAQMPLLQLPADQIRFVIKDWNSTNGLPQNTVLEMLQGRDGYIWIATYGGLCRFDGSKIEVFDTVTAPGLRSNRITCLCEGEDGTLWIGSDQGGVASLRDGRFQAESRIGESRIACLAIDGAGRLLVGTDAALLRETGEGFAPLHAGSLQGVRRIERRRSGKMLACTPSGLWEFDEADASRLTDTATNCVAEATGRLFVGTEQGLFQLADGHLQAFAPLPCLSQRILALYVATDGALWIGTGARAVRIDASALSSTESQSGSAGAMPMMPIAESQAARCLGEDREGGIWVGHTESGISRLRQAEVLSHRSSRGLPPNGIVSVSGDGHGELFAGTRYGLLHSEKGHFRPVPGAAKFGACDEICLDPDGTLWVSTPAGLVRVQAGGNGEQDAQLWLDRAVLRRWPLRVITRDANGDHWLGGDFGLVLMSGKDLTLPPVAEPLRNQPMRTITLAPDGALWLGGSTMLVRIDPERRSLRTWRSGTDLPFGEIRSILPETGAKAWLATYGSGMVRIDEDRCAVVDEEHGLVDQSLCAAIPTRDSLLLVSNLGFALASVSDLLSVASGQSPTLACRPLLIEGPWVSECNGGAHSCTAVANGRIWACGIQSLFEFDPASIGALHAELPVMADFLYVGRERTRQRLDIEVPVGVRGLNVGLGTCSFDHPGQTRYRWRMVGQSDWTPPTYRSDVHLTNLPPGDMVFEAQAIRLDDVPSREPLRITAHIPYLMSETRWFRFGLPAFGVLAIALLLRFVSRQTAQRAARLQKIVDARTQQLRAAQQQLEHRVEERTKELQAAMLQQQAAMTERQQLERQVQQLQRMESIGQLAGGIAHDFNNILTVAFGASQLLAEDVTSEDARELCRNLALACERGRGLTQHLLAVASRQVVTATTIDLNTVVQDLLPVLRSLLGEDVVLHFQPAPSPARVLAAVTQIEQIILNLAVNAHDAMPRGGEVRIRVTLDDDRVRLDLRDTGVGIPPEIIERVFEPFFSTKGRGRGRGLGLATVYGITKQLGGEIGVDSAVGRGTTVNLALPVAHAEDTLPVRPIPRAVPQHLRGTVLLVEDERDVRAVLSRILSNLGCEVVAVESGDAAVVQLRDGATRIDAVVSDVLMPGLRGKDLVLALREIRPGLPILFLSGYVDGRMTHQDLTDMGLDILEKPVDTDRLATLLHRLLGTVDARLPAANPPAASKSHPTPADDPHH